MQNKPRTERLLGIYKNEVKKNLKRKYNIPEWKAEIGIKKFGLENDFMKHTEDYEFIEPERVAIEVFEDILEKRHLFEVNDKYVLGIVKRQPSHYRIRKTTRDKVGQRSVLKSKRVVRVKSPKNTANEKLALHPTSVHDPHQNYTLKETE